MSQPSPAELLHHHVKYEFEMLRDTYAQIGSHNDPIIANALIESFCVHARGLFEFFQKTNGARKYADAAYTPFAGGDETRRGQLTRKLNNQVSHVMDGRTADPSLKIGDTERAEMFALLSAEYANFTAHLLPAHGAPNPPLTFPVRSARVTTTNEIVIVHSMGDSPAAKQKT